jgi:hypothetical protein
MVVEGVKTLQAASAPSKIRTIGEATQWGEMKAVCGGGSAFSLQGVFDDGSNQPSLSENSAGFMETQ